MPNDTKKINPDENTGAFILPEFDGTDESDEGKNLSPKKRRKSFAALHEKSKKPQKDHFRDQAFVQDHSIVSSVEDYAMRVRLDADEYADIRLKEADQYHDTNIQIIETKNKELERRRTDIETEIETLTVERDKIYGQIKKDAHKEGFREGKNEMLEQSEENIQRIASITRDLDNFYKKLLAKYEKSLMESALVIAAKIIKSEIETGKDVIVNTVKHVLKAHRDEGKIKLHVNPADYDLIADKQNMFDRYIDQDSGLSVEINTNVSPGSVQIETDIFYFDSDIGEQLEQMKSEIKKVYYERLMKLSKTPEIF